ncbi:MAG: hypothetical protein ACK44Z_13290 [Pirellulaceae bacterium]
MHFAPTSGSHRGHAVDVFEGRRFWVIHHLAMVATKIAVDVFEGRWFWVIHHLAMVATKIAVDVFEGRRFRVIYYLAMVATGLAIPFIDLACPTRIRLLDTDSSP